MRLLEKIYFKNGYRFEQIERTGDIAIYAQIDTDSNKVVAYEVFRISQHGAKEINGRHLPAREATPANSEWGVLGHTYWHLSAAKEKATNMFAVSQLRKIVKRSPFKGITININQKLKQYG